MRYCAGDTRNDIHIDIHRYEISAVRCSAVGIICNIKWWISIIWWNPIIWWNAIIWWIPIILNIHVASLAQVQHTSLHPPVWTLTGRQATWGASTSLIHDNDFPLYENFLFGIWWIAIILTEQCMMELHHIMMLIHHKLYDSYKLYYCRITVHLDI